MSSGYNMMDVAILFYLYSYITLSFYYLERKYLKQSPCVY